MSRELYRKLSPEPVPVDTVAFNDGARLRSAQQGSDALPKAQIRSGQHFLSAEAVASIKQARGW